MSPLLQTVSQPALINFGMKSVRPVPISNGRRARDRPDCPFEIIGLTSYLRPHLEQPHQRQTRPALRANYDVQTI